MTKKIKNYGIDLKKEQNEIQKEDWIFGAESIRGIAENIDFEKYLPMGEVQKGREDTMDCATRSPINTLETKFSYLVFENKLSPSNIDWLMENGYINNRGYVNFSDAFIAILSGTTRQGNSLKAPLEAIRKNGLIPKNLLPLEKWMRWSDYHNKNRITKEMMDLGQEFLKRFPINYERVFDYNFKNVIDWDMIGLAGYAWPKPKNGIYPSVNYAPNHAFVYFRKPAYQIFDNYIDSFDGDFIKNLAGNYHLLYYGYRVIVNETGSSKKKVMTQNELDNLYNLGFFRDSDDSAKGYLNHDHPFVVPELLKAPEHEIYDRAISFLRLTGLIKFFDKNHILGKIFRKK